MIRRFAPWLGVFILALVGIYLAVFGVDPLADPGIVVQIGGTVFAALSLIVGGLRESIRFGSRTVSWNVLVGVAYLLLAVGFVLPTLQPALTEGGTSAWIMVGVAVIGGGSLGWFGVQIARDSRHVALHPTREVRD